MSEKLIDIAGLENMDASELASTLKDWFKENGTIAFEHGFRPGYYMCMIDENGIHRPDGIVWPFDKLNKFQLLDIVFECERYYQYCLYKA